MKRLLSTLQVTLLINACSKSTTQAPWHMDKSALRAQYAAAVDDARTALPEEICRTLPAITLPGDDERLEWLSQEGTQLLLVASVMTAADARTWHTDRNFYLGPEQGKTAMPWVTLPYDLRGRVASFRCADSLGLQMRMLQLLGLPPDYDGSYIVFFYADSEGIFRPTPDREIDDREASLNFPPNTPQEYRTWFEEYAQFAYKSSTPYPWTRLGYTYDWSVDNKSHIGPGEFVVNTGSLVRVKEKLSLWQWYQQDINKLL